ncbi:hypothetical protein EVAR_1006_1 [Eumeta japonica]|uniref:Reverse transcriptase domain-containing protein n=1 Tax=Eumeta variegata TaxID=151549 RepID=A0A4C1SE63_EUMVA|nr:hypothetical protein EVAR_1006_1 [Eumeta japonica]
MRETQTAHFKTIADNGNLDPWGLAYRAASWQRMASRNVVNELALSEGFTLNSRGAMSGLIYALCLDDDLSKDIDHHRLVGDNLLRFPFPAGVNTVVYADDVTVLVKTPSRSEIKKWSQVAFDLIREWSGCNRLSFFPAKSCSMTDSVRAISSATVLEVVLNDSLPFVQRAQTIDERASKSWISRV